MGLTPKLPETSDVAAWQRETDNGQIPLALLEVIEPPMIDPDLQAPARMYPPAAAAMTDLLAAARKAGHPMRVKYSYRTLAKQKDKWENFLGLDGIAGTDDDGTLAARPGTSNHGEALAVDLTDLGASDITWLVNHAREFKFDNGDIGSNSEPWHWTYRGGYVSEDQEEDMRFEQFQRGVQHANEGKDLPDAADPDFAFGWRMERRGTTEPRPDAPAEHFHRFRTALGRFRKTGGAVVD